MGTSRFGLQAAVEKVKRATSIGEPTMIHNNSPVSPKEGAKHLNSPRSKKSPAITPEEEIEVLRKYLKTDPKPTIREAAVKIGRSVAYTSKLPPWLDHMARKRAKGRASQSVSTITADEQIFNAQSRQHVQT